MLGAGYCCTSHKCEGICLLKGEFKMLKFLPPYCIKIDVESAAVSFGSSDKFTAILDIYRCP